MMKSKRIGLGNKLKTLVEIDVRCFFLRSDIREKIKAYFHRVLSITEPFGHKEAQERQTRAFCDFVLFRGLDLQHSLLSVIDKAVTPNDNTCRSTRLAGTKLCRL
jgi:hypothetical protein